MSSHTPFLPLLRPLQLISRLISGRVTYCILPGSIMAGVGFLRQWIAQRQLGYSNAANLMLGAGLAFLAEALVMGLVVPAAPYGPASYYNYDRTAYYTFETETIQSFQPYGLSAWLDEEQVLKITGLPIQFWRMVSGYGGNWLCCAWSGCVSGNTETDGGIPAAGA